MYKKILAITFAVMFLASILSVGSTMTPAFAVKQNHNSPNDHFRSLVKNVKVGSLPVGVAVNSKTHKIYEANSADGTISILNEKTNKIIKTIPVGSGSPTPSGCQLFVDCTSNGSFPLGVIVNEKTNTIYVANSDDNTVSVIDGKTDSVVKNIPVGSLPAFFAVNQNTNTIYTSNQDNTTSVIDGKTNTVTNTISVGSFGFGIGIDEKTNMIYWASYENGYILTINGNTNQIVGSPIKVGSEPVSVAVNSNTSTIYVSNQASGTVSVIDSKTNQVIKTLVVGSGAPLPFGCDLAECVNLGSLPEGISVNEDANTVYVALNNDGAISVIDGKTNQIMGSITVGSGPSLPLGCNVVDCTSFGSGPNFIAVNEEGNRVYVTDVYDGSLSIIDGKSHKEIANTKNVDHSHDENNEHKSQTHLRVPIKYLGVLQLVAHDIYHVDRTTGIQSEDEKLNLSTVLNYSNSEIANGGEPRNMENPITFTVAKQFGQQYLGLIASGKTPQEARNMTVASYHDAVKQAYENVFLEKFPSSVSSTESSADLTGDLALRTLHDMVPGKIKVNGTVLSIFDPSLVGKTLSASDMQQLSAPLDGKFDLALLSVPEFDPICNCIVQINLLQKDSSFATQFHTHFTFKQFLSELTDGKYDPYDQVMRILRVEFALDQ